MMTMPEARYTINMDIGTGEVTLTWFKVWTNKAKPKTKSFKTKEEADKFFDENDGARIDKYVVTVVRTDK